MASYPKTFYSWLLLAILKPLCFRPKIWEILTKHGASKPTAPASMQPTSKSAAVKRWHLPVQGQVSSQPNSSMNARRILGK